MRQSQNPQSKIAGVEPGQLALKVSKLAKLLDISRGTAYQLISRGELRAIKVGSEMRVTLTEAHRFLRDSEQGPAAMTTRPAIPCEHDR